MILVSFCDHCIIISVTIPFLRCPFFQERPGNRQQSGPVAFQAVVCVEKREKCLLKQCAIVKM